MIWTAAGYDIGSALVGTVVECAGACCDGFGDVACYGFSRSKAAADDVAGWEHPRLAHVLQANVVA